MQRKFSSIQKTCGWENLFSTLEGEIGKEETEKIFSAADRYLDEYEKKYQSVGGLTKFHVRSAYTGAALYFPLKEKFGTDRALELLDNGAKPESLKKRRSLEKMPAGMFLWLCRVMTKIFFGPGAGFTNQVYASNQKELRFDITSCPYCRTLKELGCPEVCPVFCVQDEYSYKGMANCVFERSRTLGRGDDRCDFLYRRP